MWLKKNEPLCVLNVLVKLGKFLSFISVNLTLITVHVCVLFRLGKGCSHVAAFMFKVECGVKLGYTSIYSSTVHLESDILS